MSHFKEVLEISACAELRVDLAVIDDGVVTAQRSLAGDLTDRLTGHHPDDVDTVFLQFGQQCFCGFERAFRRCLTGVQLIDSSVVRPFRVTHLLLGAADQCEDSKHKE